MDEFIARTVASAVVVEVVLMAYVGLRARRQHQRPPWLRVAALGLGIGLVAGAAGAGTATLLDSIG